MDTLQPTSDLRVAVIGMACHVPGADDCEQLWKNLQQGIESISRFSREELQDAGIGADALDDPLYVRAKGLIRNADYFDHDFFGFTAREAEITDPQQRLFLQCLWEALENAGQNPDAFDGSTAIFAGSGMNRYLLVNLHPHARKLLDTIGGMKLMIGNDKDFLATMASYKLNLKGPSVVVQTACSTSLVAVHLAVQSLLNRESDLALAGGVSVGSPLKSGYLYRDGGIMSPDGRCRPFDVDANGTVFSDGVGAVVLKRLDDALQDRDKIHAIIRGTAINNDGSRKVGFTAPSIQGQSAVIAEAMLLAGVPAHGIGYVEAHGTGTPIGDPIEAEALSRVFRDQTDRRNFCGLGSVKSNIGHVDVAAGVLGLIKAISMVRDGVIPPTPGYREPNPALNLESSPFYICTKARTWPSEMVPRRAGVSSFGIGGTNAHAVIEEPPSVLPSESSRAWHALPLSARSPKALESLRLQLAAHLKSHPDAKLSDVAYTLQRGRKMFEHRCTVLAADSEMAIRNLESHDSQWVNSGHTRHSSEPVVFLFPGQHSQFQSVGRALYDLEPIFRNKIDQCAKLALPMLGGDLRELILGDDPPTTEDLTETENAQPAVLAVSYALAQTWLGFGIEPAAMIGDDLGEYTAAVISGVLDIQDAMALVIARSRTIEVRSPVAALDVSTSAEQIAHLLKDLSVAATYRESHVVVSGARDTVYELRTKLTAAGVESKLLKNSHAFRSAVMAPMGAEFVKRASSIRFRAPQIPYISCVTGDWVDVAQATDPEYWWMQLRAPILLAKAVEHTSKKGLQVFLELGLATDFSAMALAAPEVESRISAIASLPDNAAERTTMGLLGALAKTWVFGGLKTWPDWYAAGEARRIPLCTYPFEQKRCWLEPVIHPGKHERGPLTLESVPAKDDIQTVSSLESRVTAIWAELLGRQDFGPKDSLFSIGGDSLLATQVISRIRSLLGVEIDFDSFFDEPTIEGLMKGLASAGLTENELQNISHPL